MAPTRRGPRVIAVVGRYELFEAEECREIETAYGPP
jgi:hypothetical protein